MTKRNIIFVTLLMVICFIGCSKAPDCNSDEVTNLLTKLYYEHLPATKKSAITYDGFIVEFRDDKLRKTGCKARVNFTPPIGDSPNEYITYQAQYTDDSKIYVEFKSDLIAQKQWKDSVDKAMQEVNESIDDYIDSLPNEY